jgi:hypothetical protein
MKVLKSLVAFIFFGNFFYGICITSLCIETSFQLNVPFNSFLFYIIVFFSTLLYYTLSYNAGAVKPADLNERSQWYVLHAQLIRQLKWLYTIALFIAAILFMVQHRKNLGALPVIGWIILLGTPLIAFLYKESMASVWMPLRQYGWIKPFIIGFVWAAIATLYPLIFLRIEQPQVVITHHFLTFWFFVKNWMFISLLAIMFDIKDYADDSNQQIKTFVVKMGLRKTIFYIIIPLTVIGVSAFLVFSFLNHFSIERIVCNFIPFFLLLKVAYSLQNRHSILYYFIIIDGLMLIKAICGIVGAKL